MFESGAKGTADRDTEPERWSSAIAAIGLIRRPVECSDDPWIKGTPVVDWEAEFSSAIAIHPIGQDEARSPEWFVMRYATAKEAVLLRLIGLTKIPFHHLKYEFRRPHAASTIRAWFPGILFLQFDVRRDYWQQLNRMPGMLGLLGEPLPRPLEPGVMDDVVARCPFVTAKSEPRSRVPAGCRVRIKHGPIAGTVGVVSSSDGKQVRFEAMIFGRPTSMTAGVANVEILD